MYDDVMKVLGGGNTTWTKNQVKRAHRFSESYPREWWSLEQLPEGALREQLIEEVVNGMITQGSLTYLWQAADRLETHHGEAVSGVKGRTRPGAGDMVEVFGEVDRIVLERGRMRVEFHAQSGWAGRVIIDDTDDRYLRDILPADEIRVTGMCLSAPRSSMALIGDRPAQKVGRAVTKVMTIKVWDRPGGWDT